jgi:hypothetical protein
MLEVEELRRREAAAAEQPFAREMNERLPSEFLKHYARDGREISVGTWMVLMNDKEYSRVAYDELYGYEVSTVWIGMALGNQIFETMVFARDESDPGHHDTYRYSTEAEALAGHDEVVTVIRATKGS